jgi:hypothetical protein
MQQEAGRIEARSVPSPETVSDFITDSYPNGHAEGVSAFQFDSGRYVMGFPIPACFSTAISGPRPAQQPANSPSMTTAGTDLIPSAFARSATDGSFMSRTNTLQDGHAADWISRTASRHIGQPALNTSM